jgi:hypothetical protein
MTLDSTDSDVNTVLITRRSPVQIRPPPPRNSSSEALPPVWWEGLWCVCSVTLEARDAAGRLVLEGELTESGLTQHRRWPAPNGLGPDPPVVQRGPSALGRGLPGCDLARRVQITRSTDREMRPAEVSCPISTSNRMS